MRLKGTIFFLLTISNLFAQVNEIKREIKYTAEVGTYLSTDGNTPFWLRANQYGTVPSTSPIVTLRGSISSDYKKAITKEDQYKLSKFDWGYGLNIVGNVGKENQFLIPEAYVKAKFGAFEIYAGRRKEIFGLVDSTLSSGSYIWSGNALPMPKVQISTPNFVPLGFTKGFLSFKGNYAHGWFENDRTDVKNFYLHQKSLYFRLGKPDWKFHFYGGFNHQVQWGGELKYPDPTNQFSINGKVGSSFNDYINVVTGRSLAGASDTTKNGATDALNRSGNHLGTVDFGFEVNANIFSILCYRQSIYEDGSLAYLSNIEDGLNGISFTFKKLKRANFHFNKVVFEYLNTTSQGGLIGGESPNSRLRGRDDYFSNGVYLDGWVYNHRIIGNPFITKSQIVQNKIYGNIFNNRISATNFALDFEVDIFRYVVAISNINNLGSYAHSLSENQTLVNIFSEFTLRNDYQLKTSLSFDFNKLNNDNVGVYIGIFKSW
jgi:Capsule assembly protein Wzi